VWRASLRCGDFPDAFEEPARPASGKSLSSVGQRWNFHAPVSSFQRNPKTGSQQIDRTSRSNR